MNPKGKNIFSLSMGRQATFAMGLLAMGSVFYACHDDENIIEKKSIAESVVANTPQPTEDQLTMKYGGKAVVLGSDRTDFNASVVNRMLNVSNTMTADAKVYVFTSGFNTASLSVDDAKCLVKAYMNDANFVFIDPKNVMNETFVSVVRQAIDQLAENGYDTTDAEDFVAKVKEYREQNASQQTEKMEAVAFRRKSVYTVGDLDEMADESGTNGTLISTDESGKVTEQKCSTESYDPTAYDLGLSADMLVEWLKGKTEDGGSNSEVDELMSFTSTYKHFTVGPSRALQKSMRYDLACHVYSAYDFKNDRDYYFVRMNPSFHPSALDCVRNTERGWKKSGRVVTLDDGSTVGDFIRGGDLWYGPYMTKFFLDASVVTTGSGGESVTVDKALPKTEVSGSSSFSSGFDMTLSGNFGFSAKGPSGGTSIGFSFSESHSHTEKDLKVVHSDYGGNQTQWTYTGIVPQCHYSWNIFNQMNYHDEVANFQITDWQTELTWVFVVDHPKKDHEYTMQLKHFTEIKELLYSLYDIELAVRPEYNTTFVLNMPNRFKGSYALSCSDTNLREYLSNQLSSVWKDEFTYYAHSEKEMEEGVKNLFCGSNQNSIMNSILGLRIAESKGFTGTYTFRLRKTGSSTDIASFVIADGKVTEVKK